MLGTIARVPTSRRATVSVSLDPRKAHLVRQHGDILAIYTWVNDERAMVLLPAIRAMGSPWFIVMESAAYKYDDPRYLVKMAVKAAEVIGMSETMFAARKIATIIHEGLPDLIRMPSAPPAEVSRSTIGEMKLMANGDLVAGQEIREESTGLEYA